MHHDLVLEKTLESSLDSKEIQPVHPKGNKSWIFFGRTDAKAETPMLWPPDAKNWLIWKDPDAGKYWKWDEKGMTEGETVGWHHRLNGHEFYQAPRVGDGQGGLECCSPWGCKESDWVTELTDLFFPGGLEGRESSGRARFDPWVRKTPWRRAWQPTPVFLPGEPGWIEEPRGYSLWGHKESGMTEWLSIAQHILHILSSLCLACLTGGIFKKLSQVGDLESKMWVLESKNRQTKNVIPST